MPLTVVHISPDQIGAWLARGETEVITASDIRRQRMFVVVIAKTVVNDQEVNSLRVHLG
ncbi:MAG TPA: hypothetical protein VIL63_03080 [Terriglobales bacterium]